ncbi:YutD family protein [Paenibacillus dakarensis]|uniref:YutD family protein n=1 Tax=Paenibacillus dakarensis TaxID=1527293 RepID=UPI0006D58747|nr:YutD family protein [Paenibacillus dakarensis]
MIVIGNRSYEVLVDHRNGWNPEAFRDRYSEVLERYDYIVGDWGYNQLRLKGFYRDNHPKAAKDAMYSAMSDYINEYCNFGCAYFVLQKSKEIKDPNELKELKEQELKELEMRTAQEALDKGGDSDVNPSESQDPQETNDHKPNRSNETGPKEAHEFRGKREFKEGRESRSNKSKSWKESKQRDNRDQREIRENRDMRLNSKSNNQLTK